jgi:hypothetical protein
VKRDARLHLRIEADLLKDVKKYAQKKHMSVASAVNLLLREWVQKEKDEEYIKNGLQFEVVEQDAEQI